MQCGCRCSCTGAATPDPTKKGPGHVLLHLFSWQLLELPCHRTLAPVLKHHTPSSRVLSSCALVEWSQTTEMFDRCRETSHKDHKNNENAITQCGVDYKTRRDREKQFEKEKLERAREREREKENKKRCPCTVPVLIFTHPRSQWPDPRE